MKEEHIEIYYRGYRDALRDTLAVAKETQTFTDDEELKRIVRMLWEDRVDKEEL